MRWRPTHHAQGEGIRGVPLAPPGFNAAEFFSGISWYQEWELFKGVFTPGLSNNVYSLFDDHLHVPKDLSGKRVLDIGAWNGCTSLECERRGAREVIALGPENPDNTGFNKLRDILGAKRTNYLQGTVYDLDPKKLGHFDIVLFLGVLYHLRYPLLGIDNLRRICKGTVFIETFVTDNAWIVKEQNEIKKCPQNSISTKLQTDAVWQFYRSDELDCDASNWFGPNTTAVLQAFRSAGFEVELSSTWSARAGFRADVKGTMPEFLTVSPFDRNTYDIILSPVLGKPNFADADPQTSWRTDILISDEYFQKGGDTQKGWIASLYRDLLGRDASAKDLNRQLTSLKRWLPGDRRRIVKAMLSSPEYMRKSVVGNFTKLMRRVSPEWGITCWTQQMMQGNSEEDIIAALVSSREYFCKSAMSNRRWLERVHLDLLERLPGPDSERTIESLDRGFDTRSVVAASIVNSAEYRRLWASHLLSRQKPAVQTTAAA